VSGWLIGALLFIAVIIDCIAVLARVENEQMPAPGSRRISHEDH
jgi:hypothetical protein